MLVQITVDGDQDAFPCRRAFRESGSQRLWWDLRYLHQDLSAHGEQRAWQDWIKWVRRGLASEGEPPGAAPEGADTAHLLTSGALARFLAFSVAWGRTATVLVRCLAILLSLLSRGFAATPLGEEIPMNFSTGVSTLSFVGVPDRVRGWAALVASLPATARDITVAAWAAALADGDVTEDLRSPTHSASQLFRVLLTMGRTRRKDGKRKLAAKTSMVLNALRLSMLEWVTSAGDRYFNEVYCPRHDISKPPPALRRGPAGTSGNTSRPYVRVQPESVWEMMADARRSSTSLAQAIAIRHRDAHAGCSQSLAEHFTDLSNGMYRARRDIATSVGLMHWNIVADPATHSKRETYVSVVWCWEMDFAVYGDAQWLHSGQVVLEEEAPLPDRLAELAAQRRLERVAAFRQLQACSNTLKSMSRGQVTLDAFLLPPDCIVRAVHGHETRLVQQEGERRQVYLYDQEI